MNDTQLGITIVYSIAVLIFCVIGVFVIRSTREKHRGPTDHGKLAGNENRWGMVVAVTLAAMLFATITQIPYDDTDAKADAQVVRVQAQQFGWALQPGTVRAGTPVQFRLKSRDVQHGFGVYDGHKLLFQVQVPAEGKEQRIVRTFEKPGTYEILCIEFCGFQHHAMRGVIRVVKG